MKPTMLLAALTLVGAPLVGCSAASMDGSPESTGSENEALLGAIQFPSTDATKACSQTEQTFILGAAQVGRIVAESHAYQYCIYEAMVRGIAISDDPGLVNYMGGSTLGPYESCNENGASDPSHPTAGVPVTTASTLLGDEAYVEQIVKSPNGLQITCDPTIAAGAAAQASGVLEQGANPEIFGFQKANLQRHITNNDLSFIAGSIWHEAMHEHAYHHASGAASQCGHPTDSETDAKWMVRHTVPYIVGNCMQWVIDESKAQDSCKRLACDVPNEMAVVNVVGGGEPGICSCLRDPNAPPPPQPQPETPTGCTYGPLNCANNVSFTCAPATVSHDGDLIVLKRDNGSGVYETIGKGDELNDYKSYPIARVVNYKVCRDNGALESCTSPFAVTVHTQSCTYDGSPGDPGNNGPFNPTCGKPPLKACPTLTAPNGH